MNIKNILWVAAGFISLTLGAIGIVLPLLPTTPLVILAAICFSSGNKKLDEWLSKSRIFGPFIDNYRTGKGISLARKIASIAFLWVGLVTSMIVLQAPTIYFVLTVVGVGVTVHLSMIKTKRV